jgi:hypothetical protein
MAAASAVERELLERAAERHAIDNPGARVILLVDRRSSSGGRSAPLVLLILPSNPWHALLPEAQVAEILDREPERI